MVGQLLDRVAYHLEEPFENPTAVVQYLLLEEARKRGVRVILSGHGSDEVLAGYPGNFVRPFLTDLLRRGRIGVYVREHRAFKSQAANIGPLVTSGMMLALLPAALRWRMSRAQALYRLNGVGIPFGSSRTPRHGDRAPKGIPQDALFGPELRQVPPPGFSHLDQSLWNAITRGILPMWNRMDDRMSMACSVETRAPFLDHRIVEFAFGLPADMKLRDGFTKYVLRQAMRDRLPHSIVSSRRKRKFATPYLDWLRGPWRAMVDDLLGSSCLVSAYVDMSKFRQKAQAYIAGTPQALDGHVLWRVLTTEIFLRTFGARTQSTPRGA
jgi:asparagine synthase (glutamine-hydrolysing)